MARRNWTKCRCGVKLNIKKGNKICYVCENKVRKGELDLSSTRRR